MASSSTSTENSHDDGGKGVVLYDAQPKPSLKRRPRAPRKLVPAQGGNQQKFLLKFHEKLAFAHELGRGCVSCGQNCLEKVKAFLVQISEWRAQFADLSAEVQDREILWIFGRSHRKEQEAVEPAEGGGSTSTENSPRVAKSEGTSTSDSGTDNEDLDLVPIAASHAAPPPPASGKRKYTPRQCKSKMPSVQLQGIVSDQSIYVCVATGKFLLGIGSGRYQRVAGLY